jgi:hypothetical protein
LNKKVSVEDFNDALSQKVDYNALRTSIEAKANIGEMDGIRRMLDKVFKDLEYKANFKDLEGHVMYTKNALEDLHKELLLKASIKDLCTLLDQKANVEDVN